MGLFGGRQSEGGKRPDTRTKTASQAQADELRVRARRRLLGAIVLVLVAVLVLPLLFEDTDSSDYAQPPQVVVLNTPERPDTDLTIELSEPEDDDNDLFVDAQPDSSPTETDVETLPESPALDQVGAVASPEPDSSPPARPPMAESRPAQSPTPPSDQRTDDGSVALALLEGREPPKQRRSESAQPVTAGRYVVQIAAYGAREDAEKRRVRLAEAGVTNAYIEETVSGSRSVWRLRVGSFSTRDAAQAAQTRLRTLGYDNSQLLAQ